MLLIILSLYYILVVFSKSICRNDDPVVFFVVECCATTTTSSQKYNHPQQQPLRWSSSGGGLRAMVANIGYAHLFHKVGLFDTALSSDDDTNDTTTSSAAASLTQQQPSSQFSGISTNSGGTWFSVQFFYSPQFYENVVTSNTTRTYQFILDWLSSYREYIDTVPLAPRNIFCRALNIFRNDGLLKDVADLCDFLTYFGPSFPNFIRGMLLSTSTNYDDPDLINRLVNPSNRVRPLQNTEYYIQTAVATNSKFTSPNHTTTSAMVNNSNFDYFRSLFSIFLNDWVALQPNYYNYIGPFVNTTTTTVDKSNTSSSIRLYSVPLSVQYVTPNNGSSYYTYAIEKEHLPLQSYWSDTVTSSIGTTIQLQDWDDYPLYPPPSSTSSIYVNTNTTTSKRRRKIDQTQVISPFFQGKTPTIVQMATASGSTFYPFGSVPSILAQWYSVRSNNGGMNFRQRIINRLLINALSRIITLRRDLALCSQWPDQLCGPTDTYFLDGSAGDGPCM